MAAIGTSVPPRNGDTFFDVWEWGGRPGDATSGSVDKALEAIRNYIINVRDASSPSVGPHHNPVTIYFRGSRQQWTLQRPFFLERTNWEVRGDGMTQTTITKPQGDRAPCFIIGMPRTPVNSGFLGSDGKTPTTLKPAHWVDLYGILDTSAAAAPGKRWGFNLNGDTNISCPMTPFSHGISDGWALTRKMTVDFCVDFGAGPVGSNPLFGMAHPNATLAGYYPWFFDTVAVNGDTRIRFTFATTGTNQPNNQNIYFSLGASSGMFRVSFQIDLEAATAQAYVNGNQVAVTISNQAAFRAENNLYFVQNIFAPFNIGKLTTRVVTQAPDPVNHKYYGLRVANDLMYKNRGVGLPQAKVSADASVNVAPTDFERYFDTKRNCVASFPMTDPPIGSANCYNDGRCVTIKGGNDPATHGINLTCVGYFLNVYRGATPILTSNNAIKGLTALAGATTPSGVNGTPKGSWQAAFGQAIAIGAAWEVTITDVHARGGGHGIGSLNTGANYTIYLKDIIAGGSDAAYYGHWQIVKMENFQTDVVGRTALRFVGSGGRFRDVFTGDCNAATESVVHIHSDQYGGGYSFTSFMSDSEGGWGPQKAVIIAEGHHFTPTSLRIDGLAVGKLTDDAVVIWLKDDNSAPGTDYRNPTGGDGTRLFTLTNTNIFGANHAAQIRTDGTLWSGEIRNHQMARGGYAWSEIVPMIENTGPGGVGRVKSIHKEYSAPPRGGTWAKESHVLEMQLPVAGQFATLRCVESGSYNTATPPVWSGSDVQGSGGDDMPGGYLVDNSYWAAVTL